MNGMETICRRAFESKGAMLRLSTVQKNRILRAVAEELLAKQHEIIRENEKDIRAGRENGLSEALIDRLALTPARIAGMAESLEIIADFTDPIGEVVEGFRTESELLIEKVRTPLGVIGIIYESRPNVTIDAAALCLKASNVVILRGSSNAYHSNRYLADLFCRVGSPLGLPEGAITLLGTDREELNELIRQDRYVDVLIPRGGKGLKKFISEHATIPMIVTGAGTCHAFIDESADPEMAKNIIVNGKTQRPSTCNSLECVLKHKDFPMENVLPTLYALREKGVVFHATEAFYKQLPDDLKEATDQVDEDAFGTEYLALEILLHEVDDIDAAIAFINANGTAHSDVILTKEIDHAERFLNEVDSACVYLNASTRFSDGGEFGFGGEIGISTQKLHARGPMGIRELTGLKYIIRGHGEVRK